MNDPVFIEMYSAGEPNFFPAPAQAEFLAQAFDKTLWFLLVIVMGEKNFKGLSGEVRKVAQKSDLDDRFVSLSLRVQKGFEGEGKVGQGKIVGDEGLSLIRPFWTGFKAI